MLCIQALASGSNGNAVLIKNENTALLVDAGISAKRLKDGIWESGVCPGDLSGILLTHEHSDHIQGLPIFLKKFGGTVYCSKGTGSAVKCMCQKKMDLSDYFQWIEPDTPFTLGSVTVTPFRTFHDAADPFGYRFEDGDSAIALFTDSGTVSDEIREKLKDVDALYIESNHDIRMLEMGKYPYALKRRVLSNYGHLSNEEAAETISAVYSPKLKLVILAHLSEENNYPDIARLTTENKLSEMGVLSDVSVCVATRYEKTPLFQVGEGC